MQLNWQEAIDFCYGLEFAGETDWRLPSRNELENLLDLSEYNPALPKEHPFLNVQANSYWSSTTYASYTGSAWGVYMLGGSMNYYSKVSGNYVWPVRGGQFDSSGSLIIPGLSDGQQHFTDNLNCTITDNRTGLVWIKDMDSIEVIPSDVGEDL